MDTQLVVLMIGFIFIIFGAFGVLATKRIKVPIVIAIIGMVLVFISGIIGGGIP